ncbi:hypothetical protein NL676_020484 [Syzygium grande]|nr:hypothetical protein NL676_020484 [Syzygium grande]
MLVNHLGLTLTEEDMQNVVDLMEPYGQLTNGVELLNPPLDSTICGLNHLRGRDSYLPRHVLWDFSALIVTRMVIQYGWGPDDGPAIYYHSNAVTALSMGNNHEYEIAAKVEKMYDLAYYKAKEMLQKNHRVLEKIVNKSLEFEILTGKSIF